MKDYKAISEKQAELIEIFEDWLEIDYDDEGGYQKVRRLKSEIAVLEKQIEKEKKEPKTFTDSDDIEYYRDEDGSVSYK